MAQPFTLRELSIEASGRFASDANLYEGSSTGPGTPLRQAEDTASKPNAVLDHLEWLLQQAGYVEGEDYTRESLEQPTPMAELYPAFSGSAQQRNDPPIEDLFEPRQFTEYTFCTPWVTEVFWYHPNYLGSVDLVTDLSGHAHQFFMYTAWGEPMFERSSFAGGFDAPFRFNGKELDKETGLGYYGARYYQSKLSMWLSVDPLAHKYPNMSPYAFTGNNPVMLVDPDGRAFDHYYSSTGKYLGSDGIGNGVRIHNSAATKAEFQREMRNGWSSLHKNSTPVVATDLRMQNSDGTPTGGSEGAMLVKLIPNESPSILAAVSPKSSDIGYHAENMEGTAKRTIKNDEGKIIDQFLVEKGKEGIVIGTIHNHESYSGPSLISQQTSREKNSDEKTAMENGIPVFSFDEKNGFMSVDKNRAVRSHKQTSIHGILFEILKLYGNE